MKECDVKTITIISLKKRGRLYKKITFKKPFEKSFETLQIIFIKKRKRSKKINLKSF